MASSSPSVALASVRARITMSAPSLRASTAACYVTAINRSYLVSYRGVRDITMTDEKYQSVNATDIEQSDALVII